MPICMLLLLLRNLLLIVVETILLTAIKDVEISRNDSFVVAMTVIVGVLALLMMLLNQIMTYILNKIITYKKNAYYFCTSL